MKNKISYIRNLVLFALHNNKILYFNIPFLIISACVELAAMSTVLPLSELAIDGELNKDGYWVKIYNLVNIEPTAIILLSTFAILFSIRIITNLMVQLISYKVTYDILYQLSSRAFNTIIRMYSMKEIEEKTIGYLNGITGDEAFRAGQIINQAVLFFGYLFLTIIYFIAILNYSISVSIAIILFILISLLCLYGAFQRSYRLGEMQAIFRRNAYSTFVDALNGLRSIKSFLAENYAIKRLSQDIKSYSDTLYKIEGTHLLSKNIPVLVLFFVFLAFLIFGLFQIHDEGNYSFLVIIILFLIRFFPALGQCLNALMKITAEARVGKDVTEVITNISDTNDNRIQTIQSSIENIKISDLQFSYSDNEIFSGFSIAFEAGKTYAITGQSGSGKSTLADLLVGLYMSNNESIFVNEIDINLINLHSLRKRIILLEQNIAIFNTSVIDNVKFGIEEVSEKSVIEVCRDVCIHDYIISLHNGYETILQYQGSNLSGGQKQRIGLARALLRNPDVLILDESTNAIDEETKELVLKNIKMRYKDRILIFITHDEAVMSSVDKVVALS